MNDNPVIDAELEKIARQNKRQGKLVAAVWDKSDAEFARALTIEQEHQVLEMQA